MANLRFKDIPNDTAFRFVGSKDGFFKDNEVYVKIGKRDYVVKCPAKTWADGYLPPMVHSVGSINVAIELENK